MTSADRVRPSSVTEHSLSVTSGPMATSSDRSDIPSHARGHKFKSCTVHHKTAGHSTAAKTVIAPRGHVLAKLLATSERLYAFWTSSRFAPAVWL